MDVAAAQFGIDPAEIRRRNLIDKFPYTSATGLVFDEGTYRQTLDMAVHALDLAGFRQRQQQARAEGRLSRHRLCDLFRTHRLRHAGLCRPRHGRNARAGKRSRWRWTRPDLSNCGSAPVPHGQGLRTTLAQLVADELGVPPERIRVVHGDTDRTPYGWGTFASRSLVIAGGASVLAARKVHAKLLKIASRSARSGGRRHYARRRRCPRGRHRPRHADRKPGPRRLPPDASVQGRDRSRNFRNRDLRSAGHIFQCLPRRHRRGRSRNRARDDREIRRRGRCRPPRQSDDRGRPDHRRRRAGYRQRAAGRDRVRRDGKHPHGDAGGFSAADQPRDSGHRTAAHRNADRRDAHAGEGARRRRRHRRRPPRSSMRSTTRLRRSVSAINEIPATPRRIRAALRQSGNKNS